MNIYSEKLDCRETALNNRTNDIAARENKLEENYKAQLAIIIQKKDELQRYYNNTLEIESKAKIECQRTQEKVEVLQNKITKLKTELNNARQKSKRLAEKTQQVV